MAETEKTRCRLCDASTISYERQCGRTDEEARSGSNQDCQDELQEGVLRIIATLPRYETALKSRALLISLQRFELS